MNDSDTTASNALREPGWAPAARLLLAGLLLSVLALALPASAWPRDGGPHGPRLGELLERHAEELGLSAETRDAIREIVEDSHEEGESLREDVSSARLRLHELLAEDPVDRDRVIEQVERIGELRTESQKHRIETMLEIRALLTPEQREALTAQRESFGDRIELLRDACDAELAEPCSQRGPRALHCLHRHRDALSEDCRAALDAMPRHGHGGHGKGAGCKHAKGEGCKHAKYAGCKHGGEGGCKHGRHAGHAHADGETCSDHAKCSGCSDGAKCSGCSDHGEGGSCSGDAKCSGCAEKGHGHGDGGSCGHAGCPRHAAPAESGPAE